MKRSPLLATVIVLFFLVAIPVMIVRRLSDGVLPTQAYDIVLGVGVIAWVLVSRAILRRGDTMNSLVENRLSPLWQADSLVEQSVLGVGFITKAERANALPGAQLHRLQSAHQGIEALLPPVEEAPESDFGLADSDQPARLQPTLGKAQSDDFEILATEEYVAERGDTFWSIAESRLGDGRRWKAVEALNIGRSVAPDMIFLEGAPIRIGWSLLVPITDLAESVA